MLVYHTSNIQIDCPDVLHSRLGLDFGRGFYVTRLKDQAIKYGNRFIRVGEKAFLHTYDYTPDISLNIKEFKEYDREWLDFVCACRKGGLDFNKYDIIEGGVANDRVFQTVDLYLSGIYDIDQALQQLKFQLPNNQLCFITQKAIDNCLVLLECEML